MSEEEMGGEWNAITSLETLPKAIKEAEALIRKSERERFKADAVKALERDLRCHWKPNTHHSIFRLGINRAIDVIKGLK